MSHLARHLKPKRTKRKTSRRKREEGDERQRMTSKVPSKLDLRNSKNFQIVLMGLKIIEINREDSGVNLYLNQKFRWFTFKKFQKFIALSTIRLEP